MLLTALLVASQVSAFPTFGEWPPVFPAPVGDAVASAADGIPKILSDGWSKLAANFPAFGETPNAPGDLPSLLGSAVQQAPDTAAAAAGDVAAAAGDAASNVGAAVGAGNVAAPAPAPAPGPTA